MSGATSAVDRIHAERVVAILRRVPDVEAVVDALAAGGVRLVEVTLDSEGALETIERLRANRELTVLGRTVRTPAEEAAAAAGAEACVAPALVPETVERCRALGVPAVPGALTPSEIEAAWRSACRSSSFSRAVSWDRITSATSSLRWPERRSW
jgi:2-dehydro-3-deoxyphosphogluconate aldolase/(4S)-4-hydroxy-2-oxoglutarate aldolase